MKLLLAVSFSLVLCLTSGCASVRHVSTCNTFKTGTFVYRPPGSDPSGYFLITRTDSLQTDKYYPSGNTTVFAIKWLTECTYQLQLVSTTIPFPELLQKTPFTVEILKTTDRYCVSQAQRATTEAAPLDTIWVRR